MTSSGGGTGGSAAAGTVYTTKSSSESNDKLDRGRYARRNTWFIPAFFSRLVVSNTAFNKFASHELTNTMRIPPPPVVVVVDCDRAGVTVTTHCAGRWYASPSPTAPPPASSVAAICTVRAKSAVTNNPLGKAHDDNDNNNNSGAALVLPNAANAGMNAELCMFSTPSAARRRTSSCSL
jgi:hypothetical protein